MQLLSVADANQTIASTRHLTLLERAEQRRQRALASAARSRANYERITGRPPVRLAIGVWRRLKRVLAARRP